jgi:hypothetical protein
MFDTNSVKETRMTYRTAPIPTTGSIASVVTLVACAWFLAAMGAILTDNHSEALVESTRAAVAEQRVVPDDRVTIVVEARRSAA